MSSEESEEEVDMGRRQGDDAILATHAGPSRLPMDESLGENTFGDLGREGEEELEMWDSEEEREAEAARRRVRERRAQREARGESSVGLTT